MALNRDIALSKTEKGYVAAATSSPYFCFVASSEEAVKQKVADALHFYRRGCRFESDRPLQLWV